MLRLSVILFAYIVLLETAISARPYYKILFAPNMSILDVANNATYTGTRDNIKKLLEQKEFQEALERDGEIDPGVFRKRFLGNENVGRDVQISCKMFDKLKEDGLFRLRKRAQQARQRYNAALLSIDENVSCAGMASLFLVPTSSYLEQLEDMSLNREEIERQHREDMEKQLDGAVKWFNKFGLAIKSVGNFNDCQNKNGALAHENSASEISGPPIEIICSKQDKKHESVDESTRKNTNKSVAKVLLKNRLSVLQDIQSDTSIDDYQIKIAFMQDQIRKIRRHLKRDREGCKYPYEGFHENVLLSKLKGAPDGLIFPPNPSGDKNKHTLETDY